MTTSHLVTDLDLALDRNADLHDLDHSRRKLIPLLDVRNLVRIIAIRAIQILLYVRPDFAYALVHIRIFRLRNLDVLPKMIVDTIQDLFRDLRAFLNKHVLLRIHQVRARLLIQ